MRSCSPSTWRRTRPSRRSISAASVRKSTSLRRSRPTRRYRRSISRETSSVRRVQSTSPRRSRRTRRYRRSISSNNKIGPEGAKHLSEALKTNSTLQTLDLYNNIRPEGAKHLSEALKTNSTLQTLISGTTTSTSRQRTAAKRGRQPHQAQRDLLERVPLVYVSLKAIGEQGATGPQLCGLSE